MYSLYTVYSFWQVWKSLQCTLVRSTPPYPSVPHSPFLTPLKEITRGFIVLLCIFKWCIPTIFTHLHFLHSPSPPQVPLHTLYLFYRPISHYQFLRQWLSRFPIVSPLSVYYNLVSSTPFIALPYPFPPTTHYSTTFNTYHYILWLHRCYVFWYCLCCNILFSFLSSPKFHRVVPL
jgi:hypothetical protein